MIWNIGDADRFYIEDQPQFSDSDCLQCSIEPESLIFWPQQGKEVVEVFVFG